MRIPPPVSVPQRAVGALAALALLAGACASSGDNSAGDRLRNLQDQSEEASGGISGFEDATREQSACVDRELTSRDINVVAAVTDSAAADERVAMFDVVLECVPNLGDLDSFVTVFTGNVRLGLGGTASGLSDEEGGCLLRFLLDNSPEPARSITEGDGPGDAQLFTDGAQQCFDAETLAYVDGTGGPVSYGDDARLDAFHDDCVGGDDRACDVLYFVSTIGSEYETLAVECGGRAPEPSGFCSVEVQVGDDGTFVADHSGLDVLADDCEAGAFTACDLLSQITDFDDQFHDLGFTCAGRVPTGALPDCRTRLGS